MQTQQLVSLWQFSMPSISDDWQETQPRNTVAEVARPRASALSRAVRLEYVSLTLTLFLCVTIFVPPASARATAIPVGSRVGDFTLTDVQGQERRLSQWDESRFVVLAFLGLDCPLCRLYSERLNELAQRYQSHDVAFLGISPNYSYDLDEIRQWARDHDYTFPLLKDPDATLADACGATIVPEVVLLDGERRIRYRGRIDDQLLPGLTRDKATRDDLAEAIDDLLAGRQVVVSEAQAVGCLIQRRVETADTGRWTFHDDVRPIIQRRCSSCHRPGDRAPFSLISYDQVVTWSDTIRLVLQERRMPPWYADPRHGSFANTSAITEDERRILLEWLDEGQPAGVEPIVRKSDSRLSENENNPLSHATGWSIPQPTLIVSMPESFTVPATGIIEYQYILVDLSFKEDLWVRAAEIRPGNRQVVHHSVVFLVPPGHKDPAMSGELGSACLVVDSIPQLNLPDGMAKRIPAGWKLLFVMHYTSVGTEQVDQTQVGLLLADPKDVRQEVATHVMVPEALEIPPHARNYRCELSRQFDQDVLLLSLFPHMHLRGKSFRYEADYPDGRSETLLFLAKWDFNWQHNYILSQPKHLPAGTVLRAIAHYDNSADNPANPDPTVTVRDGQQTTDEMFNAYYDFVLADQDLTRPPTLVQSIAQRARPLTTPNATAAMTASLAMVLIVIRWRRHRAQGAGCEKASLLP